MIPFRTVPTVKNPGTAAAMIAVSTSQVGLREGPSNEQPFGRWYPMPNVAWCAQFISWAAFKSGCSALIPKHAYTPSGAEWFKARGQWGTKPRVGAIVYYFNASLGRIAHVGVVTKVNADGSWIACEGNTNDDGSRSGNGVYLLRRTTTRGGGFGYPKYKAPPVAVASAIQTLNAGVKPGANNGQVRYLKSCLEKAGYATDLPNDGFYGTGVRNAVAKFHRARPEFSARPGGRDEAIGAKGFLALQREAGVK